MNAPNVIDADARHDPQSDPSWQRAREKALAMLATRKPDETISSDSFEWATVEWSKPDDERIVLRAISPNTGLWQRYTLTDDSCGCPAYPRWCWHRAFLSCFGGVAGVKHRIRMEALRGTCRICGADAPGKLICKTCFDLEANRDFGGETPARKRGGRK